MSGANYRRGADLVAIKPGETVYVQCKLDG